METYHYSPTKTRKLKQSALINGRGQHYNATNVLHPDQVAQTPLYVYNVDAGKKYRLRVVGFGVNCWYQVMKSNEPHFIRKSALEIVEMFVLNNDISCFIKFILVMVTAYNLYVSSLIFSMKPMQIRKL